MSAPKVRVFRDSLLPGFFPYDPDAWTYRCWSGRGDECLFGSYWRTQQEALTAGLAHLAAHHTAQMPPVVQTIVSSTRCTCGDLPAPGYPHFAPCPVHSYLVNTTNAVQMQMPPGYSRRCGVSLAACEALECRCVSVDVGAELGPQEAAQRFEQSWRDRHGDIWHEEADGLMHSFETAPFPREHVERKWGPLVLVPDPMNEAHNLSRKDC